MQRGLCRETHNRRICTTSNDMRRPKAATFGSGTNNSTFEGPSHNRSGYGNSTLRTQFLTAIAAYAFAVIYRRPRGFCQRYCFRRAVLEAFSAPYTFGGVDDGFYSYEPLQAVHEKRR